jgi:glycosyltransferase involved in cell wall biosynthesis
LAVPRVSVIVPAHDSAAWIDETLASVAAQTYGDWELIVADDASSDDTAERASRHPAGARVVGSERNLGPAGARNLALEHALGELVAFLDADDLWLPGYLESQVARFDAEAARPGPPVGLVACDARLRGPDGDLPGTYLGQFRRAVEPLTLERVLARNCIYVSTLVPAAVGAEVGWFAPELFGTEDHDLWVRILETRRRAVLNDEVLAVYRKGAGSVSSNIARQGANNQKTYRRALDRGRLTRRQARVARRELRYNRAMEAMAAAWFDRSPGRAVRSLPNMVWVALTRPDQWREWFAVLRTP